MKNIRFLIGVLAGVLLTAFGVASALSVFVVPQGGTGKAAFSPNSIIMSGTTATSALIASSSPVVGIITATSTTASSTLANGISLTRGCFFYQGACLTAGGSGTVTSIATTYPVLGGTITTTGTLSLAFGTTTQNFWGAYNNFSAIFATLASSTNATTTTLAITGTASNCNGTNALTTSSTGVVGCTAQPQGTVTGVTGTYPIISSGGATPAISTGFGTSTTIGVGVSSLLSVNASGVIVATSSLWYANGNNIYNANTANVGIGSSTPSQGLSLDTKNFMITGGSVSYTWASTTTSTGLNNINVNSGRNQRFFLSGPMSVVLSATSTGVQDGAQLLLKFCQDSVGSRVLTWASPQGLRWSGSNPAFYATSTLPATANICINVGLVFSGYDGFWTAMASTTSFSK